MARTDDTIRDRFHSQMEFEQAIAQQYKSAKFTTEHIARTYGISVRTVQRIAKKWKVARSLAESNRLMAQHKAYHRMRVPDHLKAKRKQLLHRVRVKLLIEHPYCALCGATVEDGVKLQIDHIDNDATNNHESNLQVLCVKCNVGKSHLNRWGVPEDGDYSSLDAQGRARARRIAGL